MTLEPILNADPVVQIHAASALAALLLGSVVLWRRKGTRHHMRLGRVWVILMLITAVSSFFIHELRTWGNFSPIHLISVYVLVSLYWAIRAIRNGNVKSHKRSMQGMFVGGLVVAGGFSLMPGRVFHRVLFDSPNFGLLTRTDAIVITFIGVAASAIFVAWLAAREKNAEQ